MNDREPYVTVADVLDHVEPSDYQTSQPSEGHQVRGDRPTRRCDEPAYTVRTSRPSAIVPTDEPMGAVDSITDLAYERLSVRDLARLQAVEGYDWPTDTTSKTRTLLGNAVPPELASSVASALPT